MSTQTRSVNEVQDLNPAIQSQYFLPQQFVNGSASLGNYMRPMFLFVPNLMTTYVQPALPQPRQIPFFLPPQTGLSVNLLPEPSSSPSPPSPPLSRASSSSSSSLSESVVRSRTQLSIVFLDWDDTLFPTTAFMKKKENLSLADLRRLGQMMRNVLTEYVKVFGEANVYIVTDAYKDWVVESLHTLSAHYMAKLKKAEAASSGMVRSCQEDGAKSKSGTTALFAERDPFAAARDMLVSSHIRIIAAQSLHAQKDSRNPSLWKVRAFKQVTIEHFKHIKGASNGDDHIFEICSVGDSESEFVASFEAKYKLNKFIKRRKTKNNVIRLHRIKLKQEPSVDAMVKQFKSLINEAAEIHAEAGSVTIQYE